MLRGPAALLGVALLASAAPAFGQELCGANLTIEQCFELSFTDRQASGPVQQQTTKATTGPQSTLPEVQTAIRDFLPPLAAALLTPGIEDDRQALSLRFNQPLGFGTVQGGVELHKPSLFGRLADTLDATARQALEDGLDDEDDVAFSLAFNVESRTLGRRFGPHRNEISDVLRTLLPGPNPGQLATLDAIAALVPRMPAAILPAMAANQACKQADFSQVQLGCFEPAFADALRRALREGAAALQELRALRRQALEDLQVITLSQLLGNQPQLNVTAGYRMRADAVGPDEWTGSVRFEWGFRDLNWLRRRCKGGFTADCLGTELRSEATREAIGRSERLTGEVNVVHRPEHDIDLTTPTLALREDASTEVEGSLTYGRYFGELEDGTRRPRVDASISFQLQTQGSTRNDRLLGQISYTHPVSDNLAGVFGLALANKPEFISEDARRFFGTLGVTYKLVGGEKD